MNFVIAGPPGSGKTTYVAEQAKRGDVIVDVDTLCSALSGRQLYDKPVAVLPAVLAARDAVVDWLADDQSVDGYVITASGKRSFHQALCERLDAELIVLDVAAEVCKERISDDVRRDSETDWNALVDQWWRDYNETDAGSGHGQETGPSEAGLRQAQPPEPRQAWPETEERAMSELETRAWDGLMVEVRAGADGKRKILQRAVPFGELSVDLGGFREVIVAGAFDIAGDIRALWQHKSEMVLGRTTAGTLALRAEEDGIYAESDPPDTTWARDAVTSIERGDVTGSSFGFFADEDEWVLTEREVIRRVIRGRLVEVSPVTFPAYPYASSQVRERAAELRAQLTAGGGTGQETGGNGDGQETGPSKDELEQLTRARGAARRRAIEILEVDCVYVA